MDWDFEERLKRVINEVGWSQTVLAERSGLHPVQINKLLSGRKKRVEAETIRKLARALNVSGDYLLGLTDEATPRKPRRRREVVA